MGNKRFFEKTCGECRYYKTGLDGSGECRRYAPRAVTLFLTHKQQEEEGSAVLTYYPLLDESEIACGEFE